LKVGKPEIEKKENEVYGAVNGNNKSAPSTT